MKITLSILANKINARLNCIKSNNLEWKENHQNSIFELCQNLPSGSGLDGRFEIDLTQSTDKKIVFFFEYHHLNSNGYYTGWTSHELILTPTFGGFCMKITGKNKNDIKCYLYDMLDEYFI